MSKILIMTDSASDISESDEKKYGISILPFKVTLGDKSYVSRVDFDNEKFFDMMAECPEIPKTSQITPYEFEEIYKKAAKDGYTDLILVLINSNGSATYANSCMARETFYEKHPEYKDSFNIYNVDGIGYNLSYGWPVTRAAVMRDDGKSAKEIYDWLCGCLPRRELYFGIYELKYAARSGRIPSAAAFIGDKLGLKPVMRIFGGEIVTAAKCRGEKALISKIVQMSVADMEKGEPYQLVYGSNKESLEEMKKAMTEAVGYEPDQVSQIGAAVAANSGPRVVGVAFTMKQQG